MVYYEGEEARDRQREHQNQGATGILRAYLASCNPGIYIGMCLVAIGHVSSVCIKFLIVPLLCLRPQFILMPPSPRTLKSKCHVPFLPRWY